MIITVFCILLLGYFLILTPLPLVYTLNSVDCHKRWVDDIEAYNTRVTKETKKIKYPIIADSERELAVRFG